MIKKEIKELKRKIAMLNNIKGAPTFSQCEEFCLLGKEVQSFFSENNTLNYELYNDYFKNLDLCLSKIEKYEKEKHELIKQVKNIEFLILFFQLFFRKETNEFAAGVLEIIANLQKRLKQIILLLESASLQKSVSRKQTFLSKVKNFLSKPR